jgi:integrase
MLILIYSEKVKKSTYRGYVIAMNTFILDRFGSVPINRSRHIDIEEFITEKTGIEYRPIIQTRHTFATIMVSTGENLGWVMKMMGHSSMKLITDKYFSYIPSVTHNDGSKFLEEYEKREERDITC